MTTEVVIFEGGKEVQREELGAVGYMVLTDKGWEVSSIQQFSTGTVQFTIKRAASTGGPDDA